MSPLANQATYGNTGLSEITLSDSSIYKFKDAMLLGLLVSVLSRVIVHNRTYLLFPTVRIMCQLNLYMLQRYHAGAMIALCGATPSICSRTGHVVTNPKHQVQRFPRHPSTLCSIRLFNNVKGRLITDPSFSCFFKASYIYHLGARRKVLQHGITSHYPSPPGSLQTAPQQPQNT
jgi:hypothetical protein